MKKTILPSRLYLGLLFVAGSVGIMSAQSTYYVAPGGSDANACINSGSPCLTIGAALSKAPLAGGVTISIAAGTYSVTSPIIINKPNITFNGAGMSSTTVSINNANNPVFRQTSNGITISNLTLTSVTPTLNAGIEVSGATSGLTVENVEFDKLGTPTGASNGSNGSGIRILNSFSTLSVKNSDFISAHQGVQSGSSGIACVGATGAGLSNIIVQGCDFQKLFIGFWSQVPVDGLTVTSNTFGFEVEDGYSGSAGIYMGDLNGAIKNVQVSGNTFNSYTRGVYIFNYSTGADASSKLENVQISDNSFVNSVWSSAIRLITQNNSTMEEIRVEGNFISQASNSFTKSLAFIDLRQGKAPSTSADDNIKIVRNCITFTAGGSFSESTWGILLRGRGIGAVQILNNSIQGNSVGGQSSPELDAYPIPPTSGIVVQTQFEGTGISSDFGSMTAGAEISIANNYIHGFDAANGYGLLFYRRDNTGAAGGIPAGARIFVQENHFEDNFKAIATGTVSDNVVSGKSNWFGSNLLVDVENKVDLGTSTTPYYLPFLDSGLEEGGSNDPNCGDGFQPAGACCCGN